MFLGYLSTTRLLEKFKCTPTVPTNSRYVSSTPRVAVKSEHEWFVWYGWYDGTPFSLSQLQPALS
jgi:hypothetical protein